MVPKKNISQAIYVHMYVGINQAPYINVSKRFNIIGKLLCPRFPHWNPYATKAL